MLSGDLGSQFQLNWSILDDVVSGLGGRLKGRWQELTIPWLLPHSSPPLPWEQLPVGFRRSPGEQPSPAASPLLLRQEELNSHPFRVISDTTRVNTQKGEGRLLIVEHENNFEFAKWLSSDGWGRGRESGYWWNSRCTHILHRNPDNSCHYTTGHPGRGKSRTIEGRQCVKPARWHLNSLGVG